MPDCRSLLPSNHTPLEIGIEKAVCQQMREIPTPLRDLWQVDTCPSELLPWLAWALSVDVWSDDWSDHRKREVIRYSVDIHRYKGTLYAVEQAIESLGIEAEVVEWFEDKKHIGRGRFYIGVDANQAGINSNAKQQILRKFIDQAKRLSAHYAIFSKDDATLDTAVIAGTATVLSDAQTPVMTENFALSLQENMAISGSFKEIKSYESALCLDPSVIALELANQRTRLKPDLAVRIVSKESDVITQTITEASAQMSIQTLLPLGVHLTELNSSPIALNACSPLNIAFESSNRTVAKQPDLAVRISTHDIAIATETYREEKATLNLNYQFEGFAKLDNQGLEATQIRAKSLLSVAFESSNHTVAKQPDLAVRISTHDIPIVTENYREEKAILNLNYQFEGFAKLDNQGLGATQIRAKSLLSVAFESSNHTVAKQPDLAVRISTHDIPISSQARVESSAALTTLSANIALTRIQNLTIRPVMQVGTQLVSRSYTQLLGHHQQLKPTAMQYNVFVSSINPVLSSNHRSERRLDALACRIANKHGALQTTHAKTERAELSTHATVGLYHRYTQQKAVTSAVLYQKTTPNTAIGLSLQQNVIHGQIDVRAKSESATVLTIRVQDRQKLIHPVRVDSHVRINTGFMGVLGTLEAQPLPRDPIDFFDLLATSNPITVTASDVLEFKQSSTVALSMRTNVRAMHAKVGAKSGLLITQGQSGFMGVLGALEAQPLPRDPINFFDLLATSTSNPITASDVLEFEQSSTVALSMRANVRAMQTKVGVNPLLLTQGQSAFIGLIYQQ